jgi:flagellar hook-associated protein 2
LSSPIGFGVSGSGTSPITLSGFNNIDFSVVINALMAQESLPLTQLQNQQVNVQTQEGLYQTLNTKLATLNTAVQALSNPVSVIPYAATSSDSTTVAATASSSAQPGRYEVVVNSLAHSQVTASTSTTPDANTTIVATGGSITIGGQQVNIGSGVTLQGLADAINNTSGITVTAGVIQTAPNAYQLILTSNSTGAASAFTISNQLTGGTGVTFADNNNNGISGDQDADNAVKATDASITINNITVTSASNVLTSSIPGVTLTLNQQNPKETVVVSVAQDPSQLTTNINTFVSAYNDIASFYSDQRAAAKAGSPNLARDPTLRAVLDDLRNAIFGTYGAGSLNSLPLVGIGFDQGGKLLVDSTALTSALTTDAAGVANLFAGNLTGAFNAIGTVLDNYSGPAGYVGTAETQLSDQLTRLQDQITQAQTRLALVKLQLQQEFSAADQIMSTLNAQSSSLSHLGISNG